MTRAAAELQIRLLHLRAHPQLLGWLGPLLVTALGGILRFWRLDQPHQLIFDEAYYVKYGISMLKVGYELRWNNEQDPNPDHLFTNGTPDIFQRPLDADFVVHPPLGKWMIAGGEALFGPTSSWGWRFAAAVCGTLSILMIARIARRMFGSTLLGCTAGFLLAIDGHHFVHSRTGLLDIFVMFWALAAFGCLVIDRDQTRERLARLAAAGADLSRGGPGLGWRWWRIAAGLSLGLCCSIKWSGLYFVVAFGLMTVLWDIGARRSVGSRNWFLVGAGRDGISAFVQMIPIALVSYLVTWVGWFASQRAWARHWSESALPETKPWYVPHWLRSLWHYHHDAYVFHVNLTSDHVFEANPWSWMVMGRPTPMFHEDWKMGERGCTSAECVKAITAVGNPAIWWTACVGVLVLLFMWALRRDWRAGAILAGLAGGYLPWFLYQHRTIFNFYAIAFTPWVILATTYVLALLLGPATADRARRTWGASAAGSIVIAAVLMFVFFWPIMTCQVIPKEQFELRMWLPGWR